ITPIISILATTLEMEPYSRFTLLFANRTTRTIMFLEELEDLKDRYPGRFHLIHVLSREPQDSDLLSGRLDAARLTKITERLLPVEIVDEWFLCGPFDMVAELRAALVVQGVDEHHVHSELFHVETTPPVRRHTVADDGDGSRVSITLDGRASTFRLRGDGPPVLAAALMFGAG